MSIAERMASMAGGHEGRRGGSPKDGHEQHDGDGIQEHLKAIHEKMGGGKHLHAHHDGMGNYTSHQVHEDGKVEGPHDHENLEALKHHMGKFFDEEEHEYGGSHNSHHDGEDGGLI